MRKKIIAMVCAIVTAFSLCGCTQTVSNDKISIVTTLFPQYDFARQIAGEHADVHLLLPPGVEGHAFEPTPSDILAINEADLFIYTGDEMEPWAKRLLSQGEISGHILNLSEGIALDPDEDDGDPDPHIWTNPQNAIVMVKNITSAICSSDTANEKYYRDNEKNYIENLNALDAEFEKTVSSAPHKEMIFASKFSLHYFAKRYGLTHMAAFDSCGEETEPSAKVMAQLIESVRAQQLSYIWYGELESTKTAEAIAAETGTQMLLFHSCHNVTKDELNAGETYLSLMKKNLEALGKGLY